MYAWTLAAARRSPHAWRMRPGPAVTNRLSLVLHQRDITWTELARRTLLSRGQLTRLRARDANPRLAVAERVAAALDVPVEAVWQLVEPWPR
jgi:transcriptional regulator with XRE-family HTH domain